MDQERHNPGEPEADACAEIVFHVKQGQAVTVQHTADLLLTTQILGLKDDLQDEFHAAPEDQEWYYQGIKLENDKSLWYYHITDSSNVIIEVRIN